MFKFFKYKAVKFLEKIPIVQILIYNNLRYFKFLFPHDKDYLALRILFNKNEKRTFVDIGGNIGLSTIGFRELGFKNNQILIFEPDKLLIKKYLNNLKKYYSNLKIFPFGLSNKNEFKNLYKAHYHNLFIHFNNSFSKNYIINKIKNNYPNKYKQFKYKHNKYELKKFDDIKYKKKICFIKIDVEGYDHFVIEGMKKFLKKNKPIFLIEFNKSNFLRIWKNLKKNYYCYSFQFDKNNFKKLYNKHFNNLMNGKILDKNYSKNSINLFFIPKNLKKKYLKKSGYFF